MPGRARRARRAPIGAIVLAQVKPFRLADTLVRPAALEVEFGSADTARAARHAGARGVES